MENEKQSCYKMIEELQKEGINEELLNQLQKIISEITLRREERIEKVKKVIDLMTTSDEVSRNISLYTMGFDEKEINYVCRCYDGYVSVNREKIYEKLVCEQFGHDYNYEGYRETECNYSTMYKCKLCGHRTYNTIEEDSLVSISNSAKQVLIKIKKK